MRVFEQAEKRLHSCPWCGPETPERPKISRLPNGFMVICTSCGLVKMAASKTITGMVNMWNTRYSPYDPGADDAAEGYI